MVKLGLIGAGLMGTAHLKSVKGNPLYKVTAICDVQMDAAERLAKTVGATAYHDIDAMLQKEDLDAVIIATSDNMHAEPLIKCAEAKKAVLLEKPFATSVEDGKRMLKAIRENGIKVQMAHLFRCLPFYINIKNAVAAGELGQVLSANVTTLNRISVPTRMLKWADKSSPSWFLLSHAIDMILWVLDARAVSVRARGFKEKLVKMGMDTYDIIKLEMQLDSGAVCNFEANWIVPDSHPVTAEVMVMVAGTDGMMCVDTGDPIMRKAVDGEYSIPGILEYEIGGYYVGLRRNMLDAFARTLEYDAPLLTNSTDGYNTLLVLDAIDRSIAANGSEITLPYET